MSLSRRLYGNRSKSHFYVEILVECHRNRHYKETDLATELEDLEKERASFDEPEEEDSDKLVVEYRSIIADFNTKENFETYKRDGWAHAWDKIEKLFEYTYPAHIVHHTNLTVKKENLDASDYFGMMDICLRPYAPKRKAMP
jgi:hypothetical protein